MVPVMVALSCANDLCAGMKNMATRAMPNAQIAAIGQCASRLHKTAGRGTAVRFIVCLRKNGFKLTVENRASFGHVPHLPPAGGYGTAVLHSDERDLRYAIALGVNIHCWSCASRVHCL